MLSILEIGVYVLAMAWMAMVVVGMKFTSLGSRAYSRRMKSGGRRDFSGVQSASIVITDM